VKRREFITLLGGAVAAWPLAARAQQLGKVHRLGQLSGGTAASRVPLLAAFMRGMNDLGYVEGQNLAIEHRYAEGRFEVLPALARMNRLYGVTMAEHGISQLVSVDLEGAVKMREAS
jgi:putative ABC transport system substrate-binding protein